MYRKAALDALFMHLYGLSLDDANDVLESFSIVREQEKAAWGDYRSKTLMLAGLEKIRAGQLPDIAT